MGDDGDVQRVIDAVKAGEPVLLPTDTVYGLRVPSEDYAARVYRLKGRRRDAADGAPCHEPRRTLFECASRAARRSGG